MGLRQKYKRFRHFMAVMTVIITLNLLVYPFSVAASFDAQGQCLLPEDIKVAMCEANACTQSKVASRVKVTVESKIKVRAALFTKSASSEIVDSIIESSSSSGAVYHGVHSMTAYTSEAAQTDSSPCTTANGFNVCKHGVEDTIAANFLKFGTKVQIPELFGDRVFIVRDRMNSRYSERVDVWMKDKGDALQFGVRKARIVVLK